MVGAEMPTATIIGKSVRVRPPPKPQKGENSSNMEASNLRSQRKVKQIRDSYPPGDPLWLLYNSELRYISAMLSDPNGIDAKIWKHIYEENKKLINAQKNDVLMEPQLKFMPYVKALTGLDPVTSTILVNRGITENVQEFIEAPIEKLETNMEGVEEAVEIIERAISKKIPVTVYGDYDADGITGIALAVSALRKIGANVDYYINKRNTGYAMHEEGIKEIASKGAPRLLITVDNGVSSHEAIELAKKLKMGVVITDHHKILDEPNPHVLVHPRNYHTYLAGVGVIFKVIHQLYKKIGRDDVFDFLDLVAIGTIADVVPLIDENRILAKNGLKLLNKKPTAPIRALTEILNINYINSQTIAFQIAPLINALSRVSGSAEQAVEFLLTSNYTEAKSIAEYLKKLNEQRKKMVEEQIWEAENLIDGHKEKILIVKSDTFSEGIIGILAGHLRLKYNRPAIVLAENGKYYKGSCRSIEGFDIEKALSECEGIENFGGHAMAAGFTIKKENYTLFCRSMLERQITLKPPEIKIDATLKKIDLELVKIIDRLEPFGEGFPLPVFIIECSIHSTKHINNKHLKIIGEPNSIVWNAYQKYITQKPEKVKLIGCPSFDFYNNSVQFVADDFIPA